MIRLSLAVVPIAVLILAQGCSSSSTSSDPGGGDGGATNDGGGIPAPSLCGSARAYIVKCAGEGELNCGADKYDAWCADNDKKVNSDAFRRAEAKCLPTVSCEANARQDCDYKSYAGETPTSAQAALVEAYCQTCDAPDVLGCKARSIKYDPNADGGPKGVSDIFIAAWELADPIVDQIREKCTGAALPAGDDPCATRFASCAAGPYLDAVPDCP